MNTIVLPEILLPANNDADFMRKWSVIACDQFTSDRAYWRALEAEIGSAPSTLHLVFPEVYLSDGDAKERIENIQRTMGEYLSGGVFRKLEKGFVLTERSTRYTKEKRYGVVLAVDLEDYSFEPQSEAAIRASEATVPERIPPRVKIRRGAKLESPHVMLLYDAPETEVLGQALSEKESLPTLYRFPLNAGGGELSGWFLDEKQATDVANKLYKTAKNGMLFAVGDGNHSLATAKTCWEELKKGLTAEERKTHPARFALCEAVSIYSPALTFEPIYRFVTGVDAEKFIAFTLSSSAYAFKREGNVLTMRGEYDAAEALKALDGGIAAYLKAFGGAVDYVHGEKELKALVKSSGGVGFLVKTVEKAQFFPTVAKNGSLPRKTFSMGEGAEKRYYTECREIL